MGKLFSERGSYRIPHVYEKLKDGIFYLTFTRVKRIPLVPIIKALGMIKDEEIMRAIGLTDSSEVIINLYEFVDIKTAEDAMDYLSKRIGISQTREIRLERIAEILDKYFLPHIGDTEDARLANAYTACKYLKRYVQETNLDVVVLVDASASMRFGTLGIKEGWGGTQASRERGGAAPARWSKFDHATATAAAMAYVCLQQRDRVGVGTFAEELRTIVKRSNARDQWRLVVQALSSEPVDGKANLPKVAEQVLSKVLNRALIVIVSDFLMPVARIREALARLRHRHHDVVLVQVLDRQEMRFDLADPAPFIGLEGEGRVNVDPPALRAAYLAALRAHLEEIVRLCRGFGFDYQRMDSHESVGPTLAALLARRNALSRGGRAG